MPRGSLEISTFEPLTADSASAVEVVRPAHPVRAYLRTRLSAVANRIPGAVIGVAVSVLLHALLVTTALWAGGKLSVHQHPVGLVGSAPHRSETPDAAMQWVSVSLGPTEPMRGSAPMSLTPALARVAAPKIPASTLAHISAELDGPSSSPASPTAREAAASSASTTDATADGAALLALAGRYVGQINARIDRAWQRPRTPIGAPTFACRVRIDQDRAGEVRSVTLERCNGEPRWRRSLLEAIESASPLPQPPDPKVFAPVVHMSFEAAAFQPGARPAEYEPLRLARAALIVPHGETGTDALARFGDELRKAKPNEVIHLTIVGTDSPSSPTEPPEKPEPPQAQ